MNEELKTRLEILTIELRRRQKRYRSSLRNVLYFCLIILIFFALYAALISYKIREIATPSTIALLIAGQLREEMTPDMKRMMLADYRPIIRDMAQANTSLLPILIPVTGNLIRRSLDRDIQHAAQETAEKISPALHAAIERILHEKSPSADLPNQAAMKIVQTIPREEYFALFKDMLIFSPGSMGRKLRDIRRKPESIWTKRDICERDLALCWLYFTEKERYRDTRHIAPLFELGGILMKGYEDLAEAADRVENQNKMKNNPVRNEVPPKK